MALRIASGSNLRLSEFFKDSSLFLLRALLAAAYLVTRPTRETWIYLQRYVFWHPSRNADWQRFAGRELGRSPHPLEMPTNPERAAAAAARLRSCRIDGAVANGGQAPSVTLEDVLAETGTTAFLVIADGCLLRETYYDGHARGTITRGFSISKSATSALMGIALDHGCVRSLDDPILRYLPELAGRGYDEVTIRHLLLMTGGLRAPRFRTPWAPGPLYYWHPDIRNLIRRAPSPATRPGELFAYNDCSTCLLGLLLERATRSSIAAYFERWIWQPVGAQYDALWSLDHAGDGLENAASGLNARAIDLTRLASLYLNAGRAGGCQIIPPGWISESVSPPPIEAPGGSIVVAGEARYYKLGWWGHRRAGGAYRFWAEGHGGQFLYCCPDRKLVIARFGSGYGRVGKNWPKLLGTIGDRFPAAL
jgi:CubicO group peptidase (beta-lactamase class C family)